MSEAYINIITTEDNSEQLWIWWKPSQQAISEFICIYLQAAWMHTFQNASFLLAFQASDPDLFIIFFISLIVFWEIFVIV